VVVIVYLNLRISATPRRVHLQATKDGYDIQMQTNHLSHFLLAQRLFPALEAAAAKRGEARIVTHSSIAHKHPRSNLHEASFGPNGGNLGGDASGMMMNGPRWQRYQQTKLANLVFALALQDRLTAAGSKVKALCAHPGLAKTNLQVTTGQQGGMAENGGWLMCMSQTAEEGTMGVLRCSLDPEAVPGGFYGPGGMMGLKGLPQHLTVHAWVNTAANKDLLWTASVKAVGADFPLAAP